MALDISKARIFSGTANNDNRMSTDVTDVLWGVGGNDVFNVGANDNWKEINLLGGGDGDDEIRFTVPVPNYDSFFYHEWGVYDASVRDAWISGVSSSKA